MKPILEDLADRVARDAHDAFAEADRMTDIGQHIAADMLRRYARICEMEADLHLRIAAA